ncbi:hypothetical protein DAPPUDRAFT_116949 [Daphnia pulex]|uniref:PRMT5 arginine-N-methyltransferase domain-containing protein n=1 Tax=Daphnia pulex TaxID=6669 RepID=E9HR20_DAPPU|nr:hypothetical protein DAPPUDRAFT_116949 [Daphnia pulex]|eukprot:EFX65794.1 hypothetical protein DAPPUDRAFT_116949 [Daphnia pulex]
MVVGAGRGPLVRAAITTAEKADRRIRVYAVEKNPNVIVTSYPRLGNDMDNHLEITSFRQSMTGSSFLLVTLRFWDKSSIPKCSMRCDPVGSVTSLTSRLLRSLADPQALFTFTHPNREMPIDNSRYELRQFPIKCDAMLHGFAGYFETVLYKDVMLSINPTTHLPGMFKSHQSKEDVPEIHFWRCVNRTHVYAIHNPLGRSHNIGL